MATQANQPQREANNDFGLPKAEFKPIPGGSNRWLKITATIVGIVLMIGVGIVYWLFQRSSPITNNFMPNTLKDYQEAENFPDDELKETDEMSDDLIENLRSEESGTEKPAPEERTKLAEATTEVAPITRVNAPQGLYYIVVASYIDIDLAMDYAKQLAKQGAYVKLIEPQKGKHFFRVAIEQEATFQGASEKAEELKYSYGAQIWVLKY